MGVAHWTKKKVCSMAGRRLAAGSTKKIRATGGRRLASKKCK